MMGFETTEVTGATLCRCLSCFSLHLSTASFSVSPTFQSEDAISQGVHNVIERGFIGHIEKVFLLWVAGDRLDLLNKCLRILLSADVMTQNLEASVREQVRGKRF